MITISWAETTTTQDPEGGDIRSLTFGEIEVDLLSLESIEISSEVTQHPVEDGIDVADHIVPKPDLVRIECWQSETPNHLRVEGARMKELDAAGAVTMQFPETQTRRLDTLETMRRIARNGFPVDIDGLQRQIEEYYISNVATQRSVENTGALVFTLDLVEVRIAETEEVAAPSPRVERGRSNANQGNQNPEDTGDDSDVDQSQSGAAAAVDTLTEAVSGLLGG